MRKNAKPYSKTYLLLNKLGKSELNRLEKFLASPYFNTNAKVLGLYKSMAKKHPEIKEIDKEKLYRKLFPEKKDRPVNEGTMRDLLSRLNKLIYKFLLQQQFEEEQNVQERLELKFLARLKGQKKFHGLLPSIQNRLDREPESIHQLLHKYKVEDAKYIYLTLHDNRAKKSNLQEMSNSFDNFYIAVKLKHFAVMVNRQNIIEEEFDYELIESVIAYVESKEIGHFPPTIQLYFLLVKLLLDYENKENFDQLTLCLKKYQNVISNSELRQVYTIAINCCRWNILNGGEIQLFALKAFSLYSQMLDEGIIFIGGKMQPGHFRNFVYYSILLEKWEEVSHFIENQQHKLPKQHRTKILNYSHAALALAQGKIDSAHSFLLGVQKETNLIDIYFSLYLRTLLVQIYFMRSEWSVLGNYLESFGKFLHRKSEIPIIYKKAYLNFIRAVKKKMQPSAEEINFSPLAERKWLQG